MRTHSTVPVTTCRPFTFKGKCEHGKDWMGLEYIGDVFKLNLGPSKSFLRTSYRRYERTCLW